MPDPQRTHGNLSHAMRDNYNEYGVDEYYRKVAATYRNPFFPSIRQVIFAIMNRWHEEEQQQEGARILDMAAGSGEVTTCLLEWEQLGHGSSRSTSTSAIAATPGPPSRAFIPPSIKRRNEQNGITLTLSSDFKLDIIATDPFTAPAYTARTSRHCHLLSFSDLADGIIPPDLEERTPLWDIIICSFALHLVPTSSELFGLLYELSGKAKWLIVIAPHKKPEIKDSWGWIRWDISNWKAADDRRGSEDALEIIREKTRLRLYRSSQY